MKEIVILIGIPASGKSTFYHARFAASHVRINRDMLGTRHREQSLFNWCLEHEQACVLDNTNTTKAIRQPFIAAGLEKGFKVAGFFFESRIKTCLERNRLRTGTGKIPDAGVRDHHSRIELPSKKEGFCRLSFVRLADGTFITENWNDEI